MSQLFVRNADEDAWTAHPLTQSVTPLPLGQAVHAGSKAAPRLHVFRDSPGESSRWALVWDRSLTVRINGRRSGLGLRVLRHQDEIRVGDGRPVFFSAEELPVVIPFPALDHKAYCTRCQLELEPGSPVVKCPGERCRGGHYYHAEAGARDCFRYGPCLVCGYEPAESQTYQWTPEEVYP